MEPSLTDGRTDINQKQMTKNIRLPDWKKGPSMRLNYVFYHRCKRKGNSVKINIWNFEVKTRCKCRGFKKSMTKKKRKNRSMVRKRVFRFLVSFFKNHMCREPRGLLEDVKEIVWREVRGSTVYVQQNQTKVYDIVLWCVTH